MVVNLYCTLERLVIYLEENHIEEWKELGYESEEEFLEDLLDCDENWTLDDFFASLPEW